MAVVTYIKLERFYRDAFMKLGFKQEDASFITDVLLSSDLYGIKSHGTQRTKYYQELIAMGAININANPEIVFETPVSAVIDGKSGMGQLVSRFAMNVAIDKAKSSGLSMVTVRNSNHYGIARYYAKMAAAQGMMGISMTNTYRLVVPTFSREAMLGTNPIAVSLPAHPYPFDFDATTSVVPYGKIEVYAKEDMEMPNNWAINEEGEDERNADRFVSNFYSKEVGGIYTLGGFGEDFGGHKGYGFSVLCDILCAVLSLGNTSNHIKGKDLTVSHFFAAVDLDIFGQKEEIQKALEKFLEELRAAKLAKDSEAVYTHGQKSTIHKKTYLREGLPILKKTLDEMRDFADEIGLHWDDYFNS